jgi:serine/threonine protein kinase
MKLLGRGSFGEVFRVSHKRTQVEYAMKILQKNKVERRNLMRYTMTERNVLSYLKHPYIVALHYAFQTSSHLVLVLNYCPGGNLQQLTAQQKRLQEPLARLYDAEVLLAIGHLHDRSIVYRDLKPENVVIDNENHCRLTDFGLSKEGVRSNMRNQSFVGSLAFIAPEILQQRGHNHTVDVYGLGVLLYAMLTGMPPFYHRDKETLFANIRHARLQMPHYVSTSAASLIEALMQREPTRRLGAVRTKDVQSHDFFDLIDFEALYRREVPVPNRDSASWAQDPSPSLRSGNKSGSGAAVSPFAGTNGGAAWRPFVRGGGGGEGSPVAGWDFSDALSRNGESASSPVSRKA